jgi:uncharacterized tellurite resistance protein B-like protein
MTANNHIKQLVKILIAAAWIDGKIQPEEREYLHRVAKEKGLSEDPELHPLLHELVPIPAEKCYQWLQEYLGDRPKLEDYQQLLEAISALIYSDGDVAIEEAKLLTRLQLLDPANQKSGFTSILQAIQQLYQRSIGNQ